MANIQICDRKTAVRSQRETQAGDVHVQITDLDSKSPHRSWWITEQALREALQTMTLDELDRFVRTSPGVRKTSAEYPMRSYYLPLIRDNRERQERGETGDALWHWRTLQPTSNSYVSAVCRWDDNSWITSSGDRVHVGDRQRAGRPTLGEERMSGHTIMLTDKQWSKVQEHGGADYIRRLIDNDSA